MAEGEKTRLIAWSNELRAVHQRLREALQVTRSAAATGKSADSRSREVLLFCHGFCAALTGHHQGEDRALFPAIAAAHPELRPALRKLGQDHALIAQLVDGVQAVIDGSVAGDVIDVHLDGIAAIMESHFQYEERQLLTVLDTLSLDADLSDVLGSL